MASSIIHIAVASEINKIIKKDSSRLLIGTIAPDISKHVGETKEKSHFLDNVENDIPNINKFLDKYKNNLNDDFVLGYFIHLYTDYLWFKYFVPEIYNKSFITKLDGTIVKCNGRMQSLYIYNDYTNLNTRLIEDYSLDLKIFYNEIPKIDNVIEEIPMDKLELIINKAGEIIENAKVHKDMVFDMNNINQFIKTSTEMILGELKELNIY